MDASLIVTRNDLCLLLIAQALGSIGWASGRGRKRRAQGAHPASASGMQPENKQEMKTSTFTEYGRRYRWQIYFLRWNPYAYPHTYTLYL